MLLKCATQNPKVEYFMTYLEIRRIKTEVPILNKQTNKHMKSQ